MEKKDIDLNMVMAGVRAISDSVNRLINSMSENRPSAIVVYGVPRGGQPVAFLVANDLSARLGIPTSVTFNADEASIIVDDLVDSGATRERFMEKYPGKPFFALVGKTDQDGWLVFPWEYDENGEDASDEDIFTRAAQRYGITADQAREVLEAAAEEETKH